MSTSKHIDKICIAITALTLVVTILFMNGAALGIQYADHVTGYETSLFSTDKVHSIDIVMNDWDSFIESCESEEYSVCTVVIDGEKMSNVAIRAKGNTSLSSVRSSGNQRYSFKLEFDHYEDKTFQGLDKLCLNNIIQDNTMMKDYITYQLMDDFGVDAPLSSYAYLTVNGEDWGLYLAVEAIEDSFLERNYGNEEGELYKPDSMSFGGGRGNGKDFNMDDFDFDSLEGWSKDDSENGENSEESASEGESSGNPWENFNPGTAFPGGNWGTSEDGESTGEMPDMSNFTPGEMPDMSSFDPDDLPEDFDGQMPDMSGFTPTEGDATQGEAVTEGEASDSTDKKASRNSFNFGFGGGGNMGGGMGSSDVKLQYIDDNADSYSNIFNNAKTDVSSADEKRLIASLKSLNNYEDLENVVDTDEVMRYFVVHNFVCNGDSYTGSMIHNYYLHESDGQLAMIPWDYNLAFGTFQGSSASSSVNTSIDNPIPGGNVDDRPMLGWIFSDESYTESYHELFAEFIDKWFSDGQLAQMISDTEDLIRPYVESDPTKFCTTEEFEAGVEALSQFVTLRAQAVSNQLNGDDTLVDVGDLNTSDMGSMGGNMGGGDKGGFSGRTESRGNKSENASEPSDASESADNEDSASSVTPPSGDSEGGEMPEMPENGEMPSGDFTPGQMPQGGQMQQGGQTPPGGFGGGQAPSNKK